VSGRFPHSRLWSLPGFSLIEAMVACAVLAIAVTGLAVSLAASHQNSTAADERGMMLQCARSLLEELAGKPFKSPNAVDAPGWKQGQPARVAYDDLFDYDGYTDLVPVENASVEFEIGKPKPGFKRAVVVQMRRDPATVTTNMGLANFAYVAVTITAPSGKTFTLPYWAARTDLRR